MTNVPTAPTSHTATPAGTPPHPALDRYYRDEATRRRKLRQWFDTAAVDYDRINAVMSFGSGARYRHDALRRLGLREGERLLDVGSGTGGVALAGQTLVGTRGTVVALDPSPGMLAQARRNGVITAVAALGERLPFADAGFDALSMGYALRHVGDLDETFAEYLRVLRPGGRLLLLEITPPRSRLGYRLLRLYLGSVVPWLTRRFQHTADAELLMRYYWDTIDQCVPPPTILARLRAAGFENVRRKVFFGVFSEYVAIRPSTATMAGGAGENNHQEKA